MSRKNSKEAKQRRRVLKQLKNTPPGYIDLIEYVRVRSNCTAGVAEKVLLSGALMVDSHPVGYKWQKNIAGESIKVLDRYVPSHLYDKIMVVKKKVEEE